MSSPLLAEMQRRRVFRALIGYGIAAFAVLQIIEPIVHGLHWSEAVVSYAVVVLAVGFPLVVGLAWIFDVHAGRIERTAPARTGGLKGLRLGLVLVGIGVLAAAPGTVWYFFVRGVAKPATSSQTSSQAPSIAVLPFADMSPGKDQEYFSDGIAEEILNALAHVEGLNVSGRTSSFSFKGKSEDLRTIGEKLGVGAVLEGSVRKAGNRVRINAQVVKVADGFHLWSQTYDRDLTDIFAVQDEIAREVVKAMKVKLLAGKGPGEQRGTNPEAYAQFLLGNQLWRDAGNSGAMLAAYEKAVALDPTWAPAWARLASARATWVRGETRAGAAARHLRALEAAEKAVAIDPGLAVAYAVRGNLRMDYQWNWDGARSDFERALALAPADAIATKGYGRLLACLGHGADAVRLQRKAVELDPLLWTNWSWLGDTYISQGQHALGRSAIQHALELSSFNKPFLIHKMIASYLLEGQVALAAAWVEKLKDEDDRLLWIQRHQAALPSTLTEQSRRVTLATRPISPAGI